MIKKTAAVYNESDKINKEIVKNHTYLDFVRNTLVCSLYTEPDHYNTQVSYIVKSNGNFIPTYFYTKISPDKDVLIPVTFQLIDMYGKSLHDFLGDCNKYVAETKGLSEFEREYGKKITEEAESMSCYDDFKSFLKDYSYDRLLNNLEWSFVETSKFYSSEASFIVTNHTVTGIEPRCVFFNLVDERNGDIYRISWDALKDFYGKTPFQFRLDYSVKMRELVQICKQISKGRISKRCAASTYGVSENQINILMSVLLL